MAYLEERVEQLEFTVSQLTKDVEFWEAKAKDQFLTVKQTAQLLSCSDQTVRNKIKAGTIYCTTKAGDARIPMSQFYEDQKKYEKAKEIKEMKKAIFG